MQKARSRGRHVLSKRGKRDIGNGKTGAHTHGRRFSLFAEAVDDLCAGPEFRLVGSPDFILRQGGKAHGDGAFPVGHGAVHRAFSPGGVKDVNAGAAMDLPDILLPDAAARHDVDPPRRLFEDGPQHLRPCLRVPGLPGGEDGPAS